MLFIAHTKTTSNMMSPIIGVFDDVQYAQQALRQRGIGRGKNCTDWGHFIRELTLNQPVDGVLDYPRTKWVGDKYDE